MAHEVITWSARRNTMLPSISSLNSLFSGFALFAAQLTNLPAAVSVAPSNRVRFPELGAKKFRMSLRADLWQHECVKFNNLNTNATWEWIRSSPRRLFVLPAKTEPQQIHTQLRVRLSTSYVYSRMAFCRSIRLALMTDLYSRLNFTILKTKRFVSTLNGSRRARTEHERTPARSRELCVLQLCRCSCTGHK